MSKRHAFVAAILAALGFVPTASAEEFPSRPITWIVPFTPGGITDTNSRIVAEELSRSLGQSVLIDNRGGAGGTVGTEQAARARPDGYTWIYATQGTMAANVSLRKNLPYDPLRSFVPVHLIAQTPNIFVAFHGSPFNTVQELIAYAKQNPGKLTYSSSGVGTGTHLVAELFKSVTGVDMLHVPYKGSAPALNDLITGRIDVMFDYPVAVGPHVESGKLKVLATTSASRLSAMPNAPTMAETRPEGDHDGKLVRHHGAGGNAGADRRSAGGGCACRAELRSRPRHPGEARQPPDDASEIGDDRVHRERDRALGGRDRQGRAGEAVAHTSSPRRRGPITPGLSI